ncbi:hypothetical protein GALMADRAFT_72818 [Galerina marginata CBS 339.88]|uniref:Alcohol acetyltransferase n=1 Tax=Galerina marginata (strain CBS 339.88) TaxID=685588 RepID=A0A067SR61_GALM3|nr:hypothetical protein GALMADRAFT_72818 [Galerina marginata CBS 339.88]
MPENSSTTLKTISNQHSYIHSVDHGPPVERKLGELEVSYFLPSLEDGVNDMYLHLGCHAPPHLVEHQRVSLVWAIMRIRHPLIASTVKMNSYEDIAFVYNVPRSPNEAIIKAEQSLEYRSQSKDDLIDAYLNGPRTLSNERLSYLIVSCADQSSGTQRNYDFLICATHFLGDGMGGHQFANDFFSLLGSPSDLTSLREVLSKEWSERCFRGRERVPTLPSSMEERLPALGVGGLGRLGTRVDFIQNQRKQVGGHTFPRDSKGSRRTVFPITSIDRERTKKILGNCKRRGVSISNALFAICNIAWARTHSTNRELPIMMYSALNIRPNLMADKCLNDSYWFLAIGYFNVILPSFFPREGDLTGIFWHRARSAKIQTAKAAKSPLSVSRCREMAKERGRQARIWAKKNNDKAMGMPPKQPVPAVALLSEPKTPSSALMGLSLLGNLDEIYKHSAFPDIKFHTLTGGWRQRSGGMLLFGYTFVEKLWVSFGYDENGFEENTVKQFWKNVIDAIDEFLLP